MASPRDRITNPGGKTPRIASPRDRITSPGGRKPQDIKYVNIKVAADAKT